MSSSKICKKCNEKIDGEMITVLDGDWHRNCFTCSTCQKPMTGFYNVGDKTICKECYEATCLKTCQKCKKSIVGQKLTDNLNRDFHPECFSCCTCSVKIDGSYFVLNEEVYCLKCHEEKRQKNKKENTKEMGSCFHCKKQILNTDGPMIVVNPNEKYHKSCLRCIKCKKEMEGEFIVADVGTHSYVCMACSN
ncbi:hypothetical protein CYY_009651 [Polysphondylium violaceum]|uniref:LIM zinc-binding domain-containing protein n=1 Tax=Polysphondylium violaceum TaxID=133409 RepID=A0A8J4UVT9_9MYCE|nr:hypothetical protein CYY_009651 [Polysphondylium violaceum]